MTVTEKSDAAAECDEDAELHADHGKIMGCSDGAHDAKVFTRAQPHNARGAHVSRGQRYFSSTLLCFVENRILRVEHHHTFCFLDLRIMQNRLILEDADHLQARILAAKERVSCSLKQHHFPPHLWNPCIRYAVLLKF